MCRAVIEVLTVVMVTVLEKHFSPKNISAELNKRSRHNLNKEQWDMIKTASIKNTFEGFDIPLAYHILRYVYVFILLLTSKGICYDWHNWIFLVENMTQKGAVLISGSSSRLYRSWLPVCLVIVLLYTCSLSCWTVLLHFKE